MRELNNLDEAQLKHEFRQMYKDLGPHHSLQVMYELIISAKILGEVINEEFHEEKEDLEP